MFHVRPQPNELAPYYAGYVAGVPDGDLLETLRQQLDDLVALVAEVPEEHGDHRYAEGKWSIREVLGHVADTERIMAYRALRIARGDGTPLAGFDEQAYVAAGRFGTRTLPSLIEELRAVREGSLTLLRTFGEEELGRWGTANGLPVTVRALAWIIAGHERHHGAILRERYLRGVTPPAPPDSP